jgi:hypothetical protein
VRYGYICEQHGPFTLEISGDYNWCRCGREAKRDWRFHLDKSFEPYYAPSFGTVVNSRSHAKDLAKIASEEATLRLGYEHDFQVVDTHDDAAVGIDTEQKKAVMENTRRHAVNGAAWSQERMAEIDRQKAQVTAERQNA